ncbi:MAG: hypothetical protein U5R31_11825 [Acidimicrobiia bacterium]|nr:hypothetical protein [Acidimicrobiia bacterium]
MEEAIEQGHFGGRDPILVSLSVWVTVHGIAEMLLIGFELDDDFVDEVIGTAIDAVLCGLDS